jgi:hypothetical protein
MTLDVTKNKKARNRGLLRIPLLLPDTA